MSNYLVDGADLTSVANAIRAKSGGSSQLAFPEGFVSEIGNIPSGGGGGGLTVVASGTYTGTGGYPSSAGTGFFVGKKMPKTNFWFKFCASSDSEFAYNTDYKYSYGLFAVFSEFGHFDLSTVGDSKDVISDITFDINNSGTVTATNAGRYVGFVNCVRNGSANNLLAPNHFRIDRRSGGFYLRPYQSNSLYKYVNGMTYNWEIVYFGSSPFTDIVEVT